MSSMYDYRTVVVGTDGSPLADPVAIAHKQRATVTAALLVDAEPATALLKTASHHSADLIVVGALRDVSIADRLLGTVASDVVRNAQCEVLIVRPCAGPRDAAALET